ncbi:MAG: hypothetical protein E6H65_12865 [Betaproteobacteria bacterium]|nr:MAG: hypothetical protein E6H65_12865 [Betaproteobacteria bacterium]
MKAPPSRLLARLDAALAKTRDPIEAACVRAERAGFLARQGYVDEAKSEIASLHAQFAGKVQPSISVWLCIVEGWLAHYGSMSAAARDKMKRAAALSAASRLTRLHALSVAWLAHMDYVQQDIDALARNAALALELAAPDHHAARARVCLVIGTAYHFADRMDLAQPWYAAAREHGHADGDEAMLTALIFNMASLHASHAILAAVFGGDADGEARRALASALSAGNFDQWIGTVSLNALVPMLRAVVASVQGQHGAALELYEAHWADAQRQGLARAAANVLADMAWCHWHLGHVDRAAVQAHAAAASIDAAMDPDDRAIANGRLAQLFKLLGDDDRALRHLRAGKDDLALHRKLQARVVDALQHLKR